MPVSLLAQAESKSLIVLCESHPHAVNKHAGACEMARKAYLRAVYGVQPPKGDQYGYVLSAVAHGSIVVVEFRSFHSRNSMFEVPLHVFKKGGVPLTSNIEIQNFVGCLVRLDMVDRYQFNGITLSNVSDIRHFSDSTIFESEPASSGSAFK
jgi:hypothetical protein